MGREHLARVIFYSFLFGKVLADYTLDLGQNCRVFPFGPY
jgi:hypothetical protein